MNHYISYYEAPFGLLKLGADETAIYELDLLYKYPWKELANKTIFEKEKLSFEQIHTLLQAQAKKEKALGINNVKKVLLFEQTPQESNINFLLEENEIIHNAKKQLDEYFRKERKTFELPLKADGTLFQQKVWNELCNIPYGEVRSYKQMAEAIKNPKAIRAIGGANHNNPIFIFIPCHRVIGANGSMVGFGGGIEVKKYLLELEGYLS